MQISEVTSDERHRRSGSIIFLSSDTSATASIARILRIIFPETFHVSRACPNPNRVGVADTETILGKTAPPEYGHLFFVKTHETLPESWISPKYRYIVNFRDPRDRLCNMYGWKCLSVGGGRRRGRAGKFREIGIDKWAMEKAEIHSKNSQEQLRYDRRTYDQLLRVMEEFPGQCLVATYARLCLDFDSFIHRLSRFTGVPVTKRMWEQLESERPGRLKNNPMWNGNRWKWEGGDVMPGRYRHELQPETIEVINKQFEPYLRKMAEYDPDYAHLYHEDLPSKNQRWESSRRSGRKRRNRSRRRVTNSKRDTA